MKQFLKGFLPLCVVFLLIQAGFRMVLGIHEYGNLASGLPSMLHSMAVGMKMDVATFLYLVPLLGLIRLCVPDRMLSPRKARALDTGLYALFIFLLLFNSVAEWLFWDELTSRFNFIAVDYLIYMDEVVGNIRESYPVPLLVSLIGGIALMVAYVFSRYFPWMRPLHMRPLRRAGVFALLCLLPALSFAVFSEGDAQFSANRYNNELAKNGLFSLFAAFKNNKLPYKDFYLAEDDGKALADLRQLLGAEGYPFVDDGITRHISHNKPEIHPNIVLITVESLSAEYLGAFGNTQRLTPNLDKLAKESLFFTNLYATGTRTVYGLSAITLSIPPIPGNAIARRPNNGNLFSLGAVLGKKGYDSRFLYGGFGYFDNMNTFFGGNGYRIVDRSALSEDEITFANIWGVCDADVYRRTLKENDASFAKGQPFFDMIMTTSNHQPFTFPDGHIDIKSGTGRFGGVKYTDYAIGQFMTEARKHPWFDNTVFVIIADHTAGSSGKLDLTPEKHHIPLMIYAPKLIQPAEVDTMTSQIDLAPTLLGLLNMDYDSRFYGRDVLRASNAEPRAFIANYQHVGLLKPDSLTVLQPVKQARLYRKHKGEYSAAGDADAKEAAEAMAYFQSASRWQLLSSDIRPTANAFVQAE